MAAEAEWDERVAAYLNRPRVPGAIEMGTLLAGAKAGWNRRVVPRTSMHDLLFTVPGYPHPFEDSVSVTWADGVFTFTLEEAGVVRSADHCRSDNAPNVLDSFLAQLVGGEPGSDDGRASDYDRAVAAVRAARDEGCPVASDPERSATVALRRLASARRRLRGTPDRERRIEDLAKGLRDHFEENPKITGPLIEDYRHLATTIVDALS